MGGESLTQLGSLFTMLSNSGLGQDDMELGLEEGPTSSNLPMAEAGSSLAYLKWAQIPRPG